MQLQQRPCHRKLPRESMGQPFIPAWTLLARSGVPVSVHLMQINPERTADGNGYLHSDAPLRLAKSEVTNANWTAWASVKFRTLFASQDQRHRHQKGKPGGHTSKCILEWSSLQTQLVFSSTTSVNPAGRQSHVGPVTIPVSSMVYPRKVLDNISSLK